MNSNVSMKWVFTWCFTSIIYFSSYNIVYLQKTWTINDPFDQKCFIENHGQYTLPDDSKTNEILYGSRVNGVLYLLSNGGVYVVYPVFNHSGINKYVSDKSGERENEPRDKIEYQYYYLEFLHTNPNNLIIAGDALPEQYYFASTNSKTVIKSKSFKNITYQEIYPNIDLVFLFTDDQKGLKYYFNIRPGGIISSIKMKLNNLIGPSKINLDNDVEIPTIIGNFIDKKPLGYYSESQIKIEMQYRLENDIITFQCSTYKDSENIIIDPWIIDPGLTSFNRGFDVDYDNFGNVYVFGGLLDLSLRKFSSSGILLWEYTYTNWSGFYGDFAVDRKSGSSYVIIGAVLYKLDPSGNMVIIPFTIPTTPNSNMNELWRVTMNSCTDEIIVGGSGTTFPSYHAISLDTNFSICNPINVLSITECCSDVGSIVIDDNGYSYIWFLTPYHLPDSLNKITKVPTSTLSPITYTINPTSRMRELTSSRFTCNPWMTFPQGNGINSMALFNTSLYTYDSFRMERWNTNDGSLVASIPINTAIDTILIYWSGIATDPCGSIYIGNKNTISQFDSSFNNIFTYACPDTVYDVKYGNGLLYISGQGFLATIPPAPLNCVLIPLQVTTTITDGGCDSNSIASISIQGGQAPYEITWFTNPPTTGSSIILGGPDTVIFQVTDFGCHNIFMDTIYAGNSAYMDLGYLDSIVSTNVFTPNSDNTNDLFYGFQLTTIDLAQKLKDASAQYEFVIYNRWGASVFNSKDPSIGWDGKIAGEEASEGVYFWVMNIIPKCSSTLTYRFNNTVSLFR